MHGPSAAVEQSGGVLGKQDWNGAAAPVAALKALL